MSFDSAPAAKISQRPSLVDETRRPIYVMTWPAAADKTTLDEFRAYFERVVARGERYGTLCDARRWAGLGRKEVRQMAAIIAEYAPRITPLCVQAVVLENDLQRAFLTSVNLFVPPRYPQRVFSRVDNALRWLETELDLR